MIKRALLAVLLAVFGVSVAQGESLARGEKISVPAGTMLHCRVTQTLTTKLNFQGDLFTATVSEPVMLDGREAIPYGATLEGRIARMERPGRIKGVGQMRLALERITFPDGRSFPLSAILTTAYGAENVKVVGSEGTVKGPSSRVADLQEVVGGTFAGGLVGWFFHEPLIGASVGGTLGLVDRLRRRGKDLTIPSGTQLNYQLTRALEIYREDAPAAPTWHPTTGSGD
jgi:hypothetical protein